MARTGAFGLDEPAFFVKPGRRAATPLRRDTSEMVNRFSKPHGAQIGLDFKLTLTCSNWDRAGRAQYLREGSYMQSDERSTTAFAEAFGSP